MNNIKQFLSGALFLAGTLIILSSCNDEENTRQAGGNLAVVFTTTVGQSIDNGAEPARAGSAPGTRLAGNTWEQDDRIGITMLGADEDLTAADVFKQYVAQSGTSATLSPAATDQTLYYPEDGSNVSFVAFYPYAAVTDRKVTYNKFDNQSTAALMAACDFVYSNEGEAFNVESQTATLNFDHKLSKLVVNVKTAIGDDAIDLSKVSVTIEGMPAKVEANLEDGTITVSEVATIIPYAPADAISATAYNAQAIIAPHSAEDYGNRKVTFTYNDGTEEKTTSSTISNDLEFKSGKVYQLNFTLTAKPDIMFVEPTGAAITDWTGGTWTYNYTINTPKNITIPAAADEHEYTFRTNYTGSVSLIYSTSATDAHAGVPSWLTKVQDPTASEPDANGMITYTYKFSAAANGNEDEQTAYLHLNVETKNVVIKVTQEGKITLALPSNCYILKPGEEITIPVSRANEFTTYNGEADDAIGDTDAFTAALLWMDAEDLVTVAGVGKGKNGGIKITAAEGKAGNAVIAVKVGINIKWSWHIWVTDYAPNPKTNRWMNRNLGATSEKASDKVKTYGLLYQWGRKDPFPNSTQADFGSEPKFYNSEGQFNYTMSTSSVSQLGYPTKIESDQSIAWTVKNPLTFIATFGSWMTSSTASDKNWDSAQKTLFDPCPEGYCVPNYNWSVPSKDDAPWNDTNFGRDLGGYYGEWYPAAGTRAPTLANQGLNGYYWCNLATSATSGGCLNLGPGNLAFQNVQDRSSGFSVRCTAESN